MANLATGARRLPRHHITIRVPWHDSGWAGTVCSKPLSNTSCLALGRIADGRHDAAEKRCAGRRLDELAADDMPPCVKERGAFMAPFEIVRTMSHPYARPSSDTHSHFAPTRFVQPPYTAACVPFRWMLRENVEGSTGSSGPGLAGQMQLGYAHDGEPELDFSTPWIQAKDNQLALLDTFFSAVRPQESLCFFYAKQTPLSEKPDRVIVGIGRVTSVGGSTEYRYNTAEPPLRSVLWERNVGHSIRPLAGRLDGFIFPYQEIAILAEQQGFDPQEFVAFAPGELFESYSYGSELLTDDGAVASLVRCAAVLQRIRGTVEGPWDSALAWVDKQLNDLWQARGAFPGLGSALSAFGYEWGLQHGSLIAYDIQLLSERKGELDHWKVLNDVMADPALLPQPTARFLTDNLRKGWQDLKEDRRALLNLLSRCTLSEDQALRFYDSHSRKEAGIQVTDRELLANPYLLFERDRDAQSPIAFDTIDRGAFPDDSVRQRFPVTEPSTVSDPTDSRRVQALVVDLLEGAAEEGHTLLPQSWLIQRARGRALQPPCPLGEDVLAAMQSTFAPIVHCKATAKGETAYQVDRLMECGSIISREVNKRVRGRKHTATQNWAQLVDNAIEDPLPETGAERRIEARARHEKAAALEVVFSSRLSVLIGPAGTGKTTLIRMLCELPDVKANGVLLLAPTGKARVRLEEQTGLRGDGKTVAQFLIGFERYNGSTGRYFPNSGAARCRDYHTVVVDECSMLTEEQLAALIDALSGVQRLVMVGDPHQLPPIGAGRPFVDIVRKLQPDGVENQFPRCAASYAELTVPRRQRGTERPDVLLASHFNGQPLDPAADSVLTKDASDGGTLRLVRWDQGEELERRLIDELMRGLGLASTEDELGFEVSLGGSRFRETPFAFFHPKSPNSPGAANKIENWQILAPLRAGAVGVDSLNRTIQARFRVQVRKLGEATKRRKVPTPFGSQGILYGDKVINIRNQRRKDVYPQEGESYVANGDIGVVVGQYKGKNAKYKGLPWKLEVEFVGQLGRKYGFSKGDFGDDREATLELAYCLTVHKTQGSEFGMTFVVLTNPCRLLSRELLYTALTRHQDKLVILHQGPIEDYRQYAGDECSEIVQRMTNLFASPAPREVSVGGSSRFLEDSLIHRTERGDLVRSKSELVIADKLHTAGIDYVYEQPLVLSGGRTRYPDFTIEDDASGITYYWEHLGLLDDPAYLTHWKRKRKEYLAAGIKPYERDQDAERILIETSDDSGGGLDAQHIGELIRSIF